MIRKKITLKKSVCLYYESILDDLVQTLFTESFDTNDSFSEKITDWKNKEINSIIILSANPVTNPASDTEKYKDKLEFLAEQIAKNSIQTDIATIPVIEEDNFFEIEKLNSKIIKSLRGGDCLLLYSEIDSEQLDFIVSTVLLHIKKNNASPENIILQVSGRGYFIENDRLLFLYLKFINKEYQLPEYIQKNIIDNEKFLFDEPLKRLTEKDFEAEILSNNTSNEFPNNPSVTFPELDSLIPVQKKTTRPNKEDTRGRKSWLTIRKKLLSIVVLTVVASLTLMFFTSVETMNEEAYLRIKEFNKTRLLLIAQKIDSDLKYIESTSSLFLKTITSPEIQKLKNGTKDFTNNFFKVNNQIIFVGKLKKAGDNYYFYSKFYNDDYFSISENSTTIIDNLNLKYKNHFKNSFLEEITVINVSPDFGSPIIGISFPSYGESNVATIVYLHPEILLKTLHTNNLSNIFMVNHSGDIIIHSNEKFIISQKNQTNIPIVKAFIESGESYGTKDYTIDDKKYFGAFQKLPFSELGLISYTKYKKAMQRASIITEQFVNILYVIIALSFIIVFFLTRKIGIQIKELNHAANNLSHGIFQINFHRKSFDELGLLQKNFLKMASELERKEKIKNTFGKLITNKLYRNFSFENISLYGEEKNCAVLLIKLNNFFQLTKELSPEHAIETLNEYYNRISVAINENQGIFDKFYEDSLIAHWGALIENENDFSNAIKCAIAIRKSIFDLNKKHILKKRPFLSLGCAINYGSVIAGQLGSVDQKEYTIIGNTVFLASEIESFNSEFDTDILVSEKIKNHCEKEFNFIKMSPVSFSESTENQNLYAVLGAIDETDSPTSLTELRKIFHLRDERPDSDQI